MKKEYRNLIIGGVVGAILLIALAGILIYRAPIRLGRRYQELLSSSFIGQLQSGEDDPLQMQITDWEVRKILNDCKVKRASQEESDGSATILVETVGEPQISIEVCKDGHVCVTVDQDTDNTQSFWQDEGELYAALYDCHLRNGGISLS